jgi:hypothetical protein
MTLQEFRDILLAADPTASHYVSDQRPNYTTWTEFGRKRLIADGHTAETVPKIQVDRFTQIEYDPVADAITQALEDADIPYEYLLDVEKDENGKLLYIHHIWDCEAG